MRNSESLIKALNLRPRGHGTSEDIGNVSAYITKELTKQAARISGILADKSRSPAQKAVFFKQYMPAVRDNNDISLVEGNHQASIDKHQATFPKQAELNTHQSILLAQSLKEASPGEKAQMVLSDPGYLTILKDLPHYYFKIDENVYNQLIERASEANFTPEQNEQTDELENDKDHISALKAAKAALVDDMEQYIKSAKPDVETADETKHLYRL